MKLKLIAATVLQLCTIICYAQADYQWIVVNNKGKTGAILENGHYVNTFSQTQTLPSSSLGTRFSLRKVSLPTRGRQQWEKNDLFVIYGDWNYFNSRETSLPYDQDFDIFYPYRDLDHLDDDDHNLYSNKKTQINYVYLTNVYEDDDPPPPVNVKSGFVSGNDMVYEFSTSSTKTITANHDVVEGRDITLIINRDTLRRGDKLSINTIRQNSTRNMYQDEYFVPSPIFGGDGAYSNIVCEYRNGAITFTGLNDATPSNPPYVYVNLRGTDKLPLYFPDSTELNSTALFGIERDGSLLLTHSEPINGSHDPNFAEAMLICKTKTNKYIRYHVEFVNTGNRQEDQLRIEIKLPPGLIRSCIGNVTFVAGGQLVNGSVENHRLMNDVVIFRFPSTASLSRYDASDPNKSVGSVAFCIKTEIDFPIQRVQSLNLLDKKVYFGTNSYEIKTFIDLKRFGKPRARPFDKNCYCRCDNPININRR